MARHKCVRETGKDDAVRVDAARAQSTGLALLMWLVGFVVGVWEARSVEKSSESARVVGFTIRGAQVVRARNESMEAFSREGATHRAQRAQTDGHIALNTLGLCKHRSRVHRGRVGEANMLERAKRFSSSDSFHRDVSSMKEGVRSHALRRGCALAFLWSLGIPPDGRQQRL
jgi:hypothetical protein